MAFIKTTTSGAIWDPKRKNPQANLQALLKQIWIEGASVFVKALAAETLVQTGESVGSLEPLARRVGAILKFRTGSGRKTRKDGSEIDRPSLNPVTGKPIPGTKRSFGTGYEAGKKAYSFEFGKGHYVFEFRIPIFQFFLHETGRAKFPKTVAIGALQRAREKQEAFVKREIQRRVNAYLERWFVLGTTNLSVVN